MSYHDFEKVCDSASKIAPNDREERKKMKCTMCSWHDDDAIAKGIDGFRHCGKFCNCFCHVVAPQFNGESAATHLRNVILEDVLTALEGMKKTVIARGRNGIEFDLQGVIPNKKISAYNQAIQDAIKTINKLSTGV